MWKCKCVSCATESSTLVKSCQGCARCWACYWIIEHRRWFYVVEGTGNCRPSVGLSPNISAAYTCNKERSVAFKIRQNAFPAGAPPRTLLWSSRRSPDPLVGWERNTILPPSALDTKSRHLRRLGLAGWGLRQCPKYFPREQRVMESLTLLILYY